MLIEAGATVDAKDWVSALNSVNMHAHASVLIGTFQMELASPKQTHSPFVQCVEMSHVTSRGYIGDVGKRCYESTVSR